MHNPRIHSILSLAFATALATTLFALPAMAESQVRIVRLSDVQGIVQINKNSGLGFENAFMNLPITQGTQLRTLDNGRAEVEFEDGSTLRLAPSTTVEFSTLNATDEGKRVSTINLVEGKAYVNWIGKSGDQFTLNFSDNKISLTQPAHFRAATSSRTAEIASFKNEIEVTGPTGPVKVPKNKMVTFDLQENDHASVAKNIESDPYDEWDQQATDYHDLYAQNKRTPYGYGSSDLDYYGSYTNVPGYGSLWQPYFAGSGWDPFTDGAWSWYPGLGFLWASAYPWGWQPYYYGNWAFVPGYGWGWQPGGFGSWHGGLHYVGAEATFHPPLAPVGTVNTVAVGKGGPVTSAATLTTVTRGSAGLGIPRGSFENLHHLNSQVAKNGSVELHGAPQFSAISSHSAGFGSGHAAGLSAAHGGGSYSGGGHSGGGSGGHSGR
jgi:hypothetical protein